MMDRAQQDCVSGGLYLEACVSHGLCRWRTVSLMVCVLEFCVSGGLCPEGVCQRCTLS